MGLKNTPPSPIKNKCQFQKWQVNWEIKDNGNEQWANSPRVICFNPGLAINFFVCFSLICLNLFQSQREEFEITVTLELAMVWEILSVYNGLVQMLAVILEEVLP